MVRNSEVPVFLSSRAADVERCAVMLKSAGIHGFLKEQEKVSEEDHTFELLVHLTDEQKALTLIDVYLKSNLN